MDDFIAKRRQAERDKREADLKTYRVLVRKLALAKLTAAEEAKLDGVLIALGRNLEMLEADTDVVRRVAQHEKEITGLSAAQDEAASIASEGAAMDQQWQQQYDRYQQARATINQQATAAAAKVSAGQAARDRLKELQASHHALLELPEPSELAKRRHLFQAVFAGNAPEGDYETVALEWAMSQPSGHADLAAIDPTDVFPLPGQSRAEVDQLLAIVRGLIQSGREGRYLLRAKDDERVKSNNNLVIFADGAGRLNLPVDISEHFHFVAAPGQTPEDISRLLAQLKMRIGKQLAEDRRNGVWTALALRAKALASNSSAAKQSNHFWSMAMLLSSLSIPQSDAEAARNIAGLPDEHLRRIVDGQNRLVRVARAELAARAASGSTIAIDGSTPTDPADAPLGRVAKVAIIRAVATLSDDALDLLREICAVAASANGGDVPLTDLQAAAVQTIVPDLNDIQKSIFAELATEADPYVTAISNVEFGRRKIQAAKNAAPQDDSGDVQDLQDGDDSDGDDDGDDGTDDGGDDAGD